MKEGVPGKRQWPKVSNASENANKIKNLHSSVISIS